MYVEPLITRAKEDSTHNRREVFRHLQNKYAVTELFSDISTKVADRPGGYTRVIKLGPRNGDGTEMAVVELVDYNDVRPEGAAGGSKKRTRVAVAAAEAARSLRLLRLPLRRSRASRPRRPTPQPARPTRPSSRSRLPTRWPRPCPSVPNPRRKPRPQPLMPPLRSRPLTPHRTRRRLRTTRKQRRTEPDHKVHRLYEGRSHSGGALFASGQVGTAVLRAV
jgi:hypothetical protein